MSKVIPSNCVSCEVFSNTLQQGCVCMEIGLDRMLFKDKTWVRFNSDFNAKKLEKSIPYWCPIKTPRAVARKERGMWTISVPLKKLVIPGLWSRFETITCGEKCIWVNPEFICKTLREQQSHLKTALGEGPFVLSKIIGYLNVGVTLFIFDDCFGKESRVNSYYFAKWTD